MDPLSITTAVVASLQVACSILSTCYSVRAQMRKIPGTLIQILNEVRDLRDLIETIESVLDQRQSSNDTDPTQLETSERLADVISPAVANCLSELQIIESRIRLEQVDVLLESKRKAFVQSLTWRLKGDDAKESIASLRRCKAALNLAISSHNLLMVRNIERISVSLDHKVTGSCRQIDAIARDLSTTRLDELQKAVINWLSPLRPAQLHQAVQGSHQIGTSEWFEHSDEFQDWFEGKNKMLWLSGPPGSGKTVLMSHAIESVARSMAKYDDKAIYAFVYCDFRNPNSQNMTTVLATILSQLCTQLGYFPEELLCAYQSSTQPGQNHFPSIEALSEAIKILSRTQRTYLFIDGMDEVEDCKSLAERVLHLVNSANHINILVTSRNEVFIQQVLKDVRRISLEHHVSEIDRDIERYIASRLSNGDDFAWLSPDVQRLISDSLLSKSRGIFQWAACQLDSLTNCRTIRDVKKSLTQLPRGLNETYKRILTRTDPSDVPLVRKIITWLAFTVVPLTLDQLWEALAVEQGARHIDDEARLRSPQDIVIVSNSLITVSSDGHVMLAHLSVRDYLFSSDIRQSSDTAQFALEAGIGHLDLARNCLTYLLFSDLSSGPSETQAEYLSRLRQLPLLPYATKYCFYHTLKAEPDGKLQTLTLNFFSPDCRRNFMSWVQVLNADSPFKWNIFPKHATSLYYAASLGLQRVVETLLRSPTFDEVDAPGSRFGGTAIHAATIRGHILIIERLISAGADPGKADFNQVTPLHSAASQGSVDTIRVLLDHGAPAEARDSMESKTPADWARLSGHEAAASLIDQYAQAGIRSCTTDLSVPVEDSQVVDIWKPRAGYFPNFYERRSGLESSLVIRMTIGEDSSYFDGEFSPLSPGGQVDGARPVW